jgi:hypothetical protein
MNCSERKRCGSLCENSDGRYCKLKYNSPDEFDDLPPDKQEAILSWVEQNLRPRKTVCYQHSSYGLKHICEKAVGFYVSNGEMKGAMLKAGYITSERKSINWSFNVTHRSVMKAASR